MMRKRATVAKSREVLEKGLCSMNISVLMWKNTSRIKIQNTGLCSLLLISLFKLKGHFSPLL